MYSLVWEAACRYLPSWWQDGPTEEIELGIVWFYVSVLFFPCVFVCVSFLYSVLMLCFPIYFTFLTIKINRDFVNLNLFFAHFVNMVSGTFLL